MEPTAGFREKLTAKSPLLGMVLRSVGPVVGEITGLFSR